MRALFVCLSLLPLAASAQTRHDPAQHHPARHDAHPHAGHDPADVRSEAVPTGLAAAERDGLLAGAGLGLAKAAERNGYPGPLHVLELADALQLTPEQRATAERLRAEMLEAAVPLGRQLVDAERQLDRLFETGTATPVAIAARTETVAGLRGRLRAVHLTAHVGMREALSDGQRATYARLRGHAE